MGERAGGRKEHTPKSPERMANAETLFTASRSPPSAPRVDQRQDHARSRSLDTRRSTLTRNRGHRQFPLVPPATPAHPPSLARSLARASAISRLPCFYVSLFVITAVRATATGVRGDIRRNCEGRERVETARQQRRGQRALRENEGEFLLFIYELFIRLVELSLSRAPLSLFPSLDSSLVLPLDERVQIRR